MIEITDGFTSISAGADSLKTLAQAYAPASGPASTSRAPTGARVTVEFQRATSLSPQQAVAVRYDFAEDGHVREFIGVPKPTRTVARQGRAVMHHYRLSHWITASALTHLSADVRPARARGIASRVIAPIDATSWR